MNKFVENWCIGSGGAGTILSSINLTQVREIFYIIFLIIQILILILGITIKFFKFIDDGKLDEEEKEELLNDIKNIEKTIDKENKDDKN